MGASTTDVAGDLTENSKICSHVMVTMANGVVAAKSSAFPILSCWFERSTGSTAIYFVTDGTTPSASSPLIVGAGRYVFPMRDLSDLKFYSTGTDVVQVFYRLGT
jgi:hypothetical protein